MAIVTGYLVATVICGVGLWIVAGRNFTVVRDPDVSLAELGGRHISILSGLAGYSVTGMVLLVTLGRSLADTGSTPYTTLLVMFFVAWMAYSATAFMFANIADGKPSENENGPRFDVAAAQFAGAAATLEFAFGLGWLALRPLFVAFNLPRLADLVAYVLVAVAFASYGLVAHHMHRSGYGPARVLIAMPCLAVLSTVAFAAIAAVFNLRSEEAALDLIISGFCVGAVAFFLLLTLKASAAHDRPARLLARYGPYAVLGYVQAIVLLVGFLLLSVVGLA